jgi:uncharacterized protein YkwD
VLALAPGGCSGPPRSAGTKIGSDPSLLAARRHFETGLLAAIDAERARVGLPPLRAATCAQDPAERWAARLAAGESLRHQPLRPIARTCRARRAGEIVGSTTRSPDSLVQSWLASRRHRRTLLGPSFTHVGIGVERAASGRWFAVADFVAF